MQLALRLRADAEPYARVLRSALSPGNLARVINWEWLNCRPYNAAPSWRHSAAPSADAMLQAALFDCNGPAQKVGCAVFRSLLWLSKAELDQVLAIGAADACRIPLADVLQAALPKRLVAAWVRAYLRHFGSTDLQIHASATHLIAALSAAAHCPLGIGSVTIRGPLYDAADETRMVTQVCTSICIATLNALHHAQSIMH